jgi:hypothetical protein
MGRTVVEEALNIVLKIVFDRVFSAVVLIDEVDICTQNILSDCKSTFIAWNHWSHTLISTLLISTLLTGNASSDSSRVANE